LILIYKIEDLIETNKNTKTKLRFWYKNEDQRSILTLFYFGISICICCYLQTQCCYFRM